MQTLQALAKSAGVSFEWLASGEGTSGLDADAPSTAAPEPPRAPTRVETSISRLELVRVGGEQHPVALPPHALAHALGLQLSPRAPRGCRGLLDHAANTIRYDGRGDPTAGGERLAHELGHHALREARVGRPHPEASVDRVAAALWMTRAAVRGALRRVGWDPELLLIELPGPPPPWVWMRAAWISERALVVWLAGVRWAYAPGGRPLPEGALERELVGIVRRTGHRHRTLLGDEAYPVGPREHRGVVILLHL